MQVHPGTTPQGAAPAYLFDMNAVMRHLRFHPLDPGKQQQPDPSSRRQIGSFPKQNWKYECPPTHFDVQNLSAIPGIRDLFPSLNDISHHLQDAHSHHPRRAVGSHRSAPTPGGGRRRFRQSGKAAQKGEKKSPADCKESEHRESKFH
jgi:hypothetical protein